MTQEGPDERAATPAEFQAMAHPLRLRILRMCLHDGLTNKEIADRLDLDPASVLHHVRTLTRTGFLQAEPVRTGKRGALEKPYRATTKSWTLSFPRPDDLLAAVIASLDAARDEVIAAGPEGLVTNTRLGLQLSDDEIEALRLRLVAVVQEFADRPPTPDGTRVGLLTMLHRLA
ncbi:winged helix-turn-helix domain-containing protein [soil metagenome]